MEKSVSVTVTKARLYGKLLALALIPCTAAVAMMQGAIPYAGKI